MDILKLLDRVDHLIYAVRDLDTATADIPRRPGLGARPSAGRHYPGRGTHSSLLAIGPRIYLEILAPDPAQPKLSFRAGSASMNSPNPGSWDGPPTPRHSTGSRTTWRCGFGLGDATSGRRAQPDGVALCWTFTDPLARVGDGLVPFLNAWNAGPHPAATATAGPPLIGLRAEHPEPHPVLESLAMLDVPLSVTEGPEPHLIALFRTEAGVVELRCRDSSTTSLRVVRSGVSA